MTTMNWDKLLCTKRGRELVGGLPSDSSDHRCEFQRDFDRMVFSSPVRRLQDKTQLFPLDPSDSVRTRLTHSLEVSAVARGIAQLACSGVAELKDRSARIETIAATVGLLHDLGNPPFGHFGEAAISEWFATELGKQSLEPINGIPELAYDFTRYEGNARTLRLLCSLQVLNDNHGMNLTAATVSAAMKYVVPSHQVSCSKSQKKPGYTFAETEKVARIREATGVGHSRHPIALLVEAADDCVYSLCDLEDAVHKSVLSWSTLREAFMAEVKAVSPEYEKRVFEMLESISAKGNSSDVDRSGDYVRAQNLRVRVASQIVDGACRSFVANYDAIMAGTFDEELVVAPQAEIGGMWVRLCKEVGKKYVYGARQVVELELRGRRVLHDLLTSLWPGVRYATATGPTKKLAGESFALAQRAWFMLSDNYRKVFANEVSRATAGWKCYSTEQIERYHQLLLLTDYVGGMTDSFACNLHRSLSNG